MGFFSTIEETRELHSNGKLRTHYYKNSYQDVLAIVRTFEREFSLNLKHVDNNHGEIYLIGSGYDMIVTCIEVTPFETSVDIKVNFFGFIGMNRPAKTIEKIYQYLDSRLRFKGVSLHP